MSKIGEIEIDAFSKIKFDTPAGLIRLRVINEILKERERQNEKWAVQNFIPAMWFSILIEEIGEAAQASNDGDMGNYRKELIQAAAVIVQMIECFDRNV